MEREGAFDLFGVNVCRIDPGILEEGYVTDQTYGTLLGNYAFRKGSLWPMTLGKV